MISTYNKFQDSHKKATLKIANILGLVVVVGSIIFFLVYRKIQYNLYDQIDHEFQTQDDYTLFVENIPILDFKESLSTEDGNYIEFDYEQALK